MFVQCPRLFPPRKSPIEHTILFYLLPNPQTWRDFGGNSSSVLSSINHLVILVSSSVVGNCLHYRQPKPLCLFMILTKLTIGIQFLLEVFPLFIDPPNINKGQKLLSDLHIDVSFDNMHIRRVTEKVGLPQGKKEWKTGRKKAIKWQGQNKNSWGLSVSLLLPPRVL